ncbi:MAG: TfoX/Sxy family DNA transformation protein [Proteobacteria bacterium]|nr:TfoX/Sxy family DNA transformation protein [Pseudomonadota bacterium]
MRKNLRYLEGFGEKSETMLAKVGVHSVEDFQQTDPFELYAKLKAAEINPGLNMIYAIIGAREGIHWQEVARTRKMEILIRLDDMGLAPK